MKSGENLISAWAFLIGVIIAIIFSVIQKYMLTAYNGWFYIILGTLGIIIGFVSVSNDSREAMTFLLATTVLVIVSSEGQQRLILIGNFGMLIVTVLNSLLTMFIPATIVVALKTLFAIASVK